MSFIFGVFAAGTVAFYILMLVFAVITSCAAGSEKKAAAFWTLVFGAAALQFLCGVPIITWTLHNPFTLIIYLAFYLAIGAAYSILKWVSYVYQKRDEVKEKGYWLSGSRYRESRVTGPPQVSDHKAQITGWIAYWPFNGAFTVLNDPIRRIAHWIYDIWCQEIMQRISNKAFENVKPKDSL